MKKMGLTLFELLAVIVVAALAMSILMPAQARVRRTAYRTVCQANLAAIGKAMTLYANDFEGCLPVAGGPEARWDNWGYIDKCDAQEPRGPSFTIEETVYGRPGINRVTVSCSLYLLVKYYNLHPEHFVCKGDLGTEPFIPTDELSPPDYWDFHCETPGKHCSYSYHMPYFDETSNPGFPLTAASRPQSPVAADRNPYLDINVSEDYLYSDFSGTGPNAAAHLYEGQNVLFLDTHVEFVRTPLLGINDNNIWTHGDYGDGTDESPPTRMGDGAPGDFFDAYLVNEIQSY